MIEPLERPRRRDAWDALSELWLDTEHDDESLGHIAHALAKTGYTWDEIARICLYEVAPAVHENLRHPAGEWTGFNLDALERRIGELTARPEHDAWVRRHEARMFALVADDWQALAERFAMLGDE